MGQQVLGEFDDDADVGRAGNGSFHTAEDERLVPLDIDLDQIDRQIGRKKIVDRASSPPRPACRVPPNSAISDIVPPEGRLAE